MSRSYIKELLTKEEIIDIANLAAARAGKVPEDYDITANRQTDGWHIDYSGKDLGQPGGGALHYIIGLDGKIVSAVYDR